MYRTHAPLAVPQPYPKFPLPPELLLTVSDHLDTFSHFNSLVLTNRSCYYLLNCRLYAKAITSLSLHTPIFTSRPLTTLAAFPSTRHQSRIYNGFRSIAGWALLHGPLGTLEKLLRYGLAVDARFTDWGWGAICGATLLMVAVLHQREDVVRFLLGRGASVDTRDDMGWRASRYVLESLVREQRGGGVGVGRRAFLMEKQMRGGEERMVVVLEGDARVYVLAGKLYRIAVMLNERRREKRRWRFR